MPRALLLALLLAGAAAGQGRAAEVYSVSRTAVLERTEAARDLAEQERAMTATLQKKVDAVRETLNAEEKALADARATLPRDEFERKAADFDGRVRRERRGAQTEAAAIGQAFRRARQRLVEALGPILEQVRAQLGASMIVDAESVLASDPKLDITERVIVLFDRQVTAPKISVPEVDLPLDSAAAEGSETGGEPAPPTLTLPEPPPAPGEGRQKPDTAPAVPTLTLSLPTAEDGTAGGRDAAPAPAPAPGAPHP